MSRQLNDKPLEIVSGSLQEMVIASNFQYIIN